MEENQLEKDIADGKKGVWFFGFSGDYANHFSLVDEDIVKNEMMLKKQFNLTGRIIPLQSMVNLCRASLSSMNITPEQIKNKPYMSPFGVYIQIEFSKVVDYRKFLENQKILNRHTVEYLEPDKEDGVPLFDDNCVSGCRPGEHKCGK